ncbi:LysR family transcriptional regulator [Endozoicomonas sp. Mp262]|uniref:LysR family transcriptional regulator n=1 Tax=Endozoicomonas sp. Mp262 TaxID=2919499 RepID=UPI0021D80A82
MRFDNLFRIDLKLLVIFQALLEERSASKTAHRLHLSQSAISKALCRLRELFDDPLFIRTPYGLEPTKRAEQLESGLRMALEQIQKLVNPAVFNPETDKRHFVIASIGSSYQVLLTGFFAHIQASAPGVTFDCHDWQPESIQQLLQGSIELAVTARQISDNPVWDLGQLPDSMHHHILAMDENICLLRKDHPFFKEPEARQNWNLSAYLKQNHVQVYCEGKDRWNLDYHLARMGYERNLAVIVPHFHAALSIAEHSDLVFTVPRLFAQQALKRHEVCMLPLPIKIEPVTCMLLWHQRYDNDLAHCWLRKSIIQHVDQMRLNTCL